VDHRPVQDIDPALVNGDEPIRDRVFRQLSRRPHAELSHNACFVKLNGLDRHVQDGRHFFDGLSLANDRNPFRRPKARVWAKSLGAFASWFIAF
jgi:hypothetical protein